MIIQEVTVKDIHPIIRGQKMSDLSNINFIVGKNGSGKSRLLNRIFDFIKRRNDHPLQIKNRSTTNNVNIYIDITFTPPSTRENINITFIDLLNPTRERDKKTDVSTNPIYRVRTNTEEKTLTANVSAFFQNARKKIGKKEVIIRHTKATTIDTGEAIPSEPVFEVDESIIKGTYNESLGTSKLAVYEQYIASALIPNKNNIIIIEEPENSLHPTAQKELVKYILNVVTDNTNVQFLISTHSPFILSAAQRSPSTKIFKINEGKIESPPNDPLTSGIKFNESHQWHWSTCDLLGVSPHDIGIPEGLCIVSEASIEMLLEYCREQGLIKNYIFISLPGGDEEFSRKAENSIDFFSSIKTGYFWEKLHPIYYKDYHIIVDHLNNQQNPDLYQSLETKIQAPNTFVILDETKLEDHYKKYLSDLLKEIISSMEDKLASEEKGEEKGKIKREYARLVAEKLCEDTENFQKNFSTLFNNKLDFLLK